ncbi:hypothetical protein GH714_037378 [Hevea brasiliensis]|uniref:RRM domain-containing protein n=1 Tax=Hevea brasiliensis TaxID=3981 RepID=A0A6A6N8T3_HEVBR|nr:hypothetical protein GH714_037378 [Hevea brasiliensis]
MKKGFELVELLMKKDRLLVLVFPERDYRSRICVKNLPKYVAEDRLREVFSQKGEITDAKLMRAKDGKSRQFAFIGFRTEHEAEEAIKYFNKSFLDTSRITCELAHKVGDPNIPRPWSRYSREKKQEVTEGGNKVDGSRNSNIKGAQVERKINKKEREKDDPQLEEFLQVMQPRVKSKLWADDTLIAPASDQNFGVNEKETQAERKSRKKEVPVDTELNKIYSHEAKKSQNLARDEVISDMDYFKSRVKKEWSDSESESSENVDDDKDDNDTENDSLKESLQSKEVKNIDQNEQHDIRGLAPVEVEEEAPFAGSDSEVLDPENPSIGSREEYLETGRLFVRNLPYTATEDELEEHFSKFGNLTQVHLVVDKNMKRSKGIAYVHYTLPECATRRHGVSKSDLLDREADDLAVRIALGETQVIAETKKALANAGVNVMSLEEYAAGRTDGMKRSNHVLIVKNLPYGSSEGELAKMFGKFGSLDRIILPPTKTLALVVFLEPSEARAAFKGLAYKRYKDAPLYLEWAPSNVLSQSPTSKSNENNIAAVGEHDAKRVMLEQSVEGISETDIDSDRIESRSLFVKNLNFKTSDESLKKHFGEHMKEGKILSVRIKKHLKNGKNVSMGFGFIEFDTVETATNVRNVLDGHALILQLCHAKKDEQVGKKVDKDRSSTKLLVRNVAFEATEKDLRQLFSPFGQIKSLRLPMKFGNHRGFAFVEYVTKQEAQNALQALSSTHLYGRHLVGSGQSKGRRSLEELRARTAAQFSEEQNVLHNPTKLSKKRKHMAVLDEGTMKFQRIAD